MDLSQQSITGREFELNRRGYDPDAVDSHLNEIATAVASRESRIAELESLVESLQAKVQDADESEEALRLTLKAAAHAKQELLAGAREQVKTMEGEAAEKAKTIVSDAEARARDLAVGAETQAAAIKQEANAQARGVATAALAESEILVSRIEALRQQLSTAESALATLSAEAGPNVATAREALDAALEQARDTVANPDLLESAAPDTILAAAPVQSEPSPEPVHLDAAAEPEVDAPTEQAEPHAIDDAQLPDAGQETEIEEAAATEPAAEAPPPESSQPEVAASNDVPEEDAPHLEVVAPAESTADISDKVDRLLEELREVT